MNLQNIDMKDYSATQNMILLTEIRDFQKQQIVEKKKEFLNSVIFNAAFMASLICALIIFDGLFEADIRFKDLPSVDIPQFFNKRVGGLNGIRVKQNNKW